MAMHFDMQRVKYKCSCNKMQPICYLYLCRHCVKLRCGDCVLNEVDCHYCPNCLENMPPGEAKLKRNRCGNCFDCPSCGHTLSTRATTVAIPNPDDPGKPNPKKMYYLACGFCRWTTRDVGIPDQSVASGGWHDQEVPQSKRISTLLEYYRQLAQKEKMEKERKKYVRRRSHLYFSDKYGLSSVAANYKSAGRISSLTINEGEEVTVGEVTTGQIVMEFPPLTEDIFTESLNLAKVTSLKQRMASPEFQPEKVSDLYPQHKHDLIRHSHRCKECEHNLSKPDFNPTSIKFKIQLIALHHIPDLRMMKPVQFHHNKESVAILTLCNPAVYSMTITLHPLSAESTLYHHNTAKVLLPTQELVISRRNDASVYDDATQEQQEFNDDPKIIAFRKSNKIGFFIKVVPNKDHGDVQVCFLLQHNYRNSVSALPSEDKEPQIVTLEHTVFMKLGQVEPSTN